MSINLTADLVCGLLEKLGRELPEGAACCVFISHGGELGCFGLGDMSPHADEIAERVRRQFITPRRPALGTDAGYGTDPACPEWFASPSSHEGAEP